MYYYLIQFLIGGILFILLYHFTKEKNTIISSIIPALPILFLVGLFYIIYFDANTIDYTNNSLFTYGLLFLFLIIFNILLNYCIKNLYLSLFLSIIIYVVIFFILIKYEILN
jgi:branched-subunit amino acid transport protein AzlD